MELPRAPAAGSFTERRLAAWQRQGGPGPCSSTRYANLFSAPCEFVFCTPFISLCCAAFIMYQVVCFVFCCGLVFWWKPSILVVSLFFCGNPRLWWFFRSGGGVNVPGSLAARRKSTHPIPKPMPVISALIGGCQAVSGEEVCRVLFVYPGCESRACHVRTGFHAFVGWLL